MDYFIFNSGRCILSCDDLAFTCNYVNNKKGNLMFLFGISWGKSNEKFGYKNMCIHDFDNTFYWMSSTK